jgi:tRNA(Ile)-lysidine synthase
MIKKIINTINTYNLIEKGDNIVVGLSGGPDSVCLLHILCTLSCRLNTSIFAVHINHMLRGEESEGDEGYVRELCGKLNVPLYVFRHDIRTISAEKGISLEEAGREIRYSRFNYVAEKVGAAKIAVAHNKNDQAETILFNLIRGTGLNGLKGMEYKSGRLIRPLLEIGREDIEAYCRENSLFPRVDSTNMETVYTRNKIRLDLIPYIDKLFNSNIVESISRMSLLIRDDYDYLEEHLSKIYEQYIIKSQDNAVWLNIKEFLKANPALQKRLIRRAIKQVKGNLKDVEGVHLESALALCKDGRTGSQIHLPDNIRVLKSYEAVKIFVHDDTASQPVFDLPLKIPGITNIEALQASIKVSLGKSPLIIEDYRNIRYNSLVQFFDHDSLGNELRVRNRGSGDRFKPYRSRGTKKLKEYFIDKKIPRDIRNTIPLIAKGNEIAWIIGYGISDKFKVTENTKSILRVEYNPPLSQKKIIEADKHIIDINEKNSGGNYAGGHRRSACRKRQNKENGERTGQGNFQ